VQHTPQRRLAASRSMLLELPAVSAELCGAYAAGMARKS